MKDETIERVLRHFDDAKLTSEEPRRWSAHCPAHPDSNPSLQVAVGRVRMLLKCWSQDCPEDEILRAAGLERRDLYYDRNPGLTLRQYASEKKLPMDFLVGLDVTEGAYSGRPHIKFRYKNEERAVVAVKQRLKMTGLHRFRWRTGDKPTLYGLWRPLEDWVLLVEGESNAQTCWLHGIPALGIPSASGWRAEFVDHLTDLDVYLWQEPDRPGRGLTVKVAKDLPEATVIPSPEGVTDISDMHLAGQDIPQLLEALKAQAIPASQIGPDNWLEEELGMRVFGLTMLRSDPPRLTMETDKGTISLGGTDGLYYRKKFCLRVLEDTSPHFTPTPSRGAWPAIRQALEDKIIDVAAPDATDAGVMCALARGFLEMGGGTQIEKIAESEKADFKRHGESQRHVGPIIIKDGRPYLHLPSFVKHIQKNERMDSKKIARDLYAIGAHPQIKPRIRAWRRTYRVWWLPDDVIEDFAAIAAFESEETDRKAGKLHFVVAPDPEVNPSDEEAEKAWDNGERGPELDL